MNNDYTNHRKESNLKKENGSSSSRVHDYERWDGYGDATEKMNMREIILTQWGIPSDWN